MKMNMETKYEEAVFGPYGALKILNDKSHPLHSEVLARVHLTDVTVGQRYLDLCVKANLIIDQPLGGGQYTEEDEEDWLSDTLPENYSTIPDEEDLQNAYDEAQQMLELLNLTNYKVSYYNPSFGWLERKPRIGDLVSIPVDLWSDMQTQEPVEERPSAALHLYDDRWFDNHRANQLAGHFPPDPTYLRITLNDLIIERGVAYSHIADRAGVSLHTVAVWKLSEYGNILTTPGLRNRFKLRWIPGKTHVSQVARFVNLCAAKRFKHLWMYSWILKSIYVFYEEEDTTITAKL